MQLYEVILYLP